MVSDIIKRVARTLDKPESWTKGVAARDIKFRNPDAHIEIYRVTYDKLD